LTKIVGGVSSTDVTEFGSSTAEIIENFTGSSGTGQNLTPDVNILFQERQTRSPFENFDSNAKFKDEKLNEAVAQLLNTEIDQCSENTNDLNQIVQYSV
jgi:hypothetical protein